MREKYFTDISQLTDEDLINHFRRCESVDIQAQLLAELTNRYQEQVVRRCRHCVKNIETARDLSQEVWIRVLTKLHQFKTEASFTPWLFTIVHNRCQDHLKRDKRLLHQEISNKIVDTLEEELDTEDIEQPTAEILAGLMDRLSGEEKYLLMLKYQQGWSVKAIAGSLGMGESNVKMKLSRTRAKLQRLLEGYKG